MRLSRRDVQRARAALERRLQEILSPEELQVVEDAVPEAARLGDQWTLSRALLDINDKIERDPIAGPIRGGLYRYYARR